jgi:hypothetical protein
MDPQLEQQIVSTPIGQVSRHPFMHQLSYNGSMLYTSNHDEFWLYQMQEMLKVDYWSEAIHLLANAPGDQTRKVLWRISYKWWDNYKKELGRIAQICWSLGAELPDSYWQQIQELERIELCLQGLEWCETGSNPTPINIVDLNHQLVESAS